VEKAKNIKEELVQLGKTSYCVLCKQVLWMAHGFKFQSVPTGVFKEHRPLQARERRADLRMRQGTQEILSFKDM